jgi:Ca2+-transporting ATPase
MAIQALVAAEAFYLVSISRFFPAIIAKLRGRREPFSYAVLFGIGGAFLFQLLFSQWNVMNQLFDTAALNLSQALLCVAIGLPMIGLATLLRRFAPLK